VFAAIACQFERKYRTTAQNATESQLKEFDFDDEDTIPLAGSISDLADTEPTAKATAERMAKDVKQTKKGNLTKPREAEEKPIQATTQGCAQTAPGVRIIPGSSKA
jgi:tRNA (guanine9-N1)-methyltransferase